jgi:hypothetical protein
VALNETGEAYGFVYEAIFLLRIIREQIDQPRTEIPTISQIIDLLEAYIGQRAN